MKEPPDHTAELRAANLLSLDGMIVPKYCRRRSGWSFRAESVSVKMTPLFAKILLQTAVDHFGLVLPSLPRGTSFPLRECRGGRKCGGYLRERRSSRAPALPRRGRNKRCPGSRGGLGRRPTWAWASRRKWPARLRRNSVIQAGSFFIAEISRHDLFVDPLAALENILVGRIVEAVLIVPHSHIALQISCHLLSSRAQTAVFFLLRSLFYFLHDAVTSASEIASVPSIHVFSSDCPVR